MRWFFLSTHLIFFLASVEILVLHHLKFFSFVMKLQKQSLEKSCVTKHDIVLQLNDSTSCLAFLNFNKNLSNCYPYLDHQ